VSRNVAGRVGTAHADRAARRYGCPVAGYPPMMMRFTTERLVLRRWDLSDVQNYRKLVAERGDGMPTSGDIRDRIVGQLSATTDTGIALLAVQRLVVATSSDTAD
jgi:hypothetical protein